MRTKMVLTLITLFFLAAGVVQGSEPAFEAQFPGEPSNPSCFKAVTFEVENPSASKLSQAPASPSDPVFFEETPARFNAPSFCIGEPGVPRVFTTVSPSQVLSPDGVAFFSPSSSNLPLPAAFVDGFAPILPGNGFDFFENRGVFQNSTSSRNAIVDPNAFVIA